MADGGLAIAAVSVLKTICGKLFALASMAETSCCVKDIPCGSCWCMPIPGLVITWAPFSIIGELAPTGLSVTVWQSPRDSPLMMTPAPPPGIRELPLSNSGWEVVRNPLEPFRISWPPVLQGTPEKEMI